MTLEEARESRGSYKTRVVVGRHLFEGTGHPTDLLWLCSLTPVAAATQDHDDDEIHPLIAHTHRSNTPWQRLAFQRCRQHALCLPAQEASTCCLNPVREQCQSSLENDQQPSYCRVSRCIQTLRGHACHVTTSVPGCISL